MSDENYVHKYYGKTIKKASFKDDKIIITFSDGVIIKIKDDGQSCCEHRYMTTDDDIKWLEEKNLMEMVLKDAPGEEGEYGDCHDIQFLEIITDQGSIQFANHNKHNGYYGGFCLVVEEIRNANT